MADLTIYRGVLGVQVLTSQAGRSYWRITDDTGVEWTTWTANVATAAGNIQAGQLATMQVRIAPAQDPQYGMNFTLKAIGPAPQGAQPTPAGQEMQQAEQMQAMPQATPTPQQMMPTVQQVPQQQPTAMAPAVQSPVKTLGQGGNFSDADLTRMARSTAIEAVVGAAFVPADFRDEEENVDWMRVYAAAEAISKFILQRAHQGWIPGLELDAPDKPSNEQQVLAEVQAQLGDGLVDQGFAENPDTLPMAEASSDNAEGGDVAWDG